MDKSDAWEAPDGTRWLLAKDKAGPFWVGWQPGEEGMWMVDVKEFNRMYPEAA